MARPRSKPRADLSRIQVRLGRAAWPGLAAALTANGDPGVSDRVRQLLTLGALAEQAGLAVAGPPTAPVLVQLEAGAAIATPVSSRRSDSPSPAPQAAQPRASRAGSVSTGAPPASSHEQLSGTEPAAASATQPDEEAVADDAPLPVSEAGSALLQSLGVL